MKLSERLIAERAFVEMELGDLTICYRCKSTLYTYSDMCTADLSEACEGFRAIEAAKKKFDSDYEKGRG